MANDFSYLEKLKPTRTEKFYMPEIPNDAGTPFLEVAAATQANKPYWAALLKEQAQRSRMSQRNSAKAMNRRLNEGRESDRGLYPKFVVKGWGFIPGMKDGVKVSAVPYSEDEVVAFLAALPDHILDRCRAMCSDDENFSEGLADGEDLAKV